MCTLLIAYEAHPRYRLVLAANRDEYYQRATAAAHFWEDAPSIFAGRDLVHGGTWLGVTADGRLAALTNYREGQVAAKHGPSRGKLVSDFLAEETAAERFAERARDHGPCSGYNLIMGDRRGLFYYSNRSEQPIRRVEPGIHGLSNHLLDTPWPKVALGKERLARVLAAEDFAVEELFEILADRVKAPDEQLPDTGVGLELERLLSSIFIESERYGTRSSTVLLMDREGQASLVERTFDGGTSRDVKATFDWSPHP